ncbi:MAG TPA: molybdopterin dinucleotide binding domain-containing protein, partial [Solirubrobacteraceae bacterium]
QALERASLVVAHATLLTEALREHADIVFPAQSYAEKEGTLVHPDGRVQRLRQAIGNPRETRGEWQVLGDVAARVGLDLEVRTASMASAQLMAAVPFYAGLSLDSIGARGVRWPETVAAAGLIAGTPGPFELDDPPAPGETNGALRVGTFRPIWAAPEVEASPALRFLAVRQRAELSPEDAARLGLTSGQRVVLADDEAELEAEALVRAAVPPGTVFLEEGLERHPANALAQNEVELHAAAGNGAAPAGVAGDLAPLRAGAGPDEVVQ